MKLYKKMVLTSILLLPMMVQASGIGFYVPMAATTTSTTEDNDFDLTEDIDYKSAVGIGFVYDSNVGEDEMYGYRLGLEYLNMSMDSININGSLAPSDYYRGDEKATRINIVNTFEFGLVTSKSIRFWIGPRVNIAYQGYTRQVGTYSYDENIMEFGIAPALGTNFNLGSVVSLGFDVDYRFAALAGTWTQENPDRDGSSTGTAKGLTARFYLLFRFGETRNDVAQVSNTNNNTNTTPSSQDDDSVIDDSL